MLVVADTSPFIALLKIAQVDILPELYGSVVIPQQVAIELASLKRPPEIQAFIANPPEWLSTRSPSKLEIIKGLDEGECAAINLARELKADLLLIDENKGREAANAGVLADLQAAFDRLKATNFRVPPKVLDELLLEHRRIKGK